MAERLEFSYDERDDVRTIEGMKYSGMFFRMLGRHGLAIGSLVRIVKRVDGTVVLETVEESPRA